MTSLVSYSPATGEALGQVEKTPLADVDKAIQKARKAQPAWAALSFDERAALVRKACATFTKDKERIGTLIHHEMGKPLKEGIGEAAECGDVDDDLIDMKKAFEPQVHENTRVRSTVYQDPYGVSAVITPWNWPLAMPHWMILPSLMAGNSVVFKPSEQTPLVGQAYADAFLAVLPKGVLNVVHGDEEQGKALVKGEVDLIAFTGSRTAGKAIMKVAADRLTRVILELGGKDPLIVLEGADLDKAARFAARNSFRNAGQVCVSTERIFVEEQIHDAFVEKLVEESAKMEIGPMVSEEQRDHVLQHLQSAKAAGAKVVFGDEKHAGQYVQPTVLTEVSSAMTIAQEETFGPIATVTRVKDAQDALKQANDTRFGLGAVFFAAQNEQNRALARKLGAGMVGFNRSIGGTGETPWVGARESGYGFHSGVIGHQQFAQLRVFSESL